MHSRSGKNWGRMVRLGLRRNGHTTFSLYSGSNDDLEQRRERTWLSLHASYDERLSSVWDDDDISWLDVRSRVLEEAEVVACVVVEAVGRHRDNGTPGRIPEWREAPRR